ncbi:MAG: sigma-54 interaction domain-containing protein [Thermodesulfobacteriota bacterium]
MTLAHQSNGSDQALWDLMVICPMEEIPSGLARVLPAEKFRLLWSKDPLEASDRLQEEKPKLVLLAPGAFKSSQRELLGALARMQDRIPLILLVEKPEEALPFKELMEAGRCDVLLGPQPPENLKVMVEAALDRERLHKEVQYLRHREPYIHDFGRIVAQSPAMKSIIALVRKVAWSDATVLVQGETGTGKELIAAAIHFNSPRCGSPFLAVNCAALHEELLESELFGHERGAFTGADRQRMGRFEQADGGTLFLDEVGDMSPRLQAKLLRVLQEKSFERLGGTRTIKVDVRILAATNQDLRRAVEEKRFRKDLYYRLSVVPVWLPPLRDRAQDILPLARFFLQKYSSREARSVHGFDASAEEALLRYHWPGNVRELENVVERALVVAQGPRITAPDLMLPKMEAGLKAHIQLPPEGVRLEEVERSLILQALERTSWVQRKAAKLLGVSARALHYKIRKYRIGLPRTKRGD